MLTKYQPDIKAFRTPDVMSCHPLHPQKIYIFDDKTTMGKMFLNTDCMVNHLQFFYLNEEHRCVVRQSAINIRRTISPNGIVLFVSSNKTVVNTFFRKAEPSCTTETGQYLLDLWHS